MQIISDIFLKLSNTGRKEDCQQNNTKSSNEWDIVTYRHDSIKIFPIP